MKKMLVANRGEIAIRVFRACTELNIPTVGIYAAEDENSIHRFKADEAYLVGKGKKPIDAYLDIEDIIRVAKQVGQMRFIPAMVSYRKISHLLNDVGEEGITFVGPSIHHLDIFGDKIKAKTVALKARSRLYTGPRDLF